MTTNALALAFPVVLFSRPQPLSIHTAAELLLRIEEADWRVFQAKCAAPTLGRWRVDLIGKRLQHVGTVEAATEADAIETAVKELRIAPALRFKLMVTKVKD